MGRRATLLLLACGVVFAVPAAAQFEDSAETLLEQQIARDAEEGLKPASKPAAAPGGGAGIDGTQPYLFVAVDEPTEFAYAVDIGDNTFTQLFTGNDPWGAAIIPGVNPGDAVVFFTSGFELYRWQSGAPVLCCNLTYQAANHTVVSAAYNAVTEELYFSRNISTEAIYSLAVPGGTCPASCEVTQDIVYPSTADIGGLAYDSVGGVLYGTDDGASDSLVRINNDGTLTVIAAYPAGQTDIDGLAYGDGKLYLVTDEPGSIYVYDIAGGAFGTPLTNPWTTSELFSAGAYGTGLVPVLLQSLTVE